MLETAVVVSTSIMDTQTQMHIGYSSYMHLCLCINKQYGCFIYDSVDTSSCLKFSYSTSFQIQKIVTIVGYIRKTLEDI